MCVRICVVLFTLCVQQQLAHALPRAALRSTHSRRLPFEASGMGAGADEPVRGSVRVVSVGPHFFRHAAAGAGMFPGGFPSARRAPSPSPRGALPDFLALGHAGPSRSSHMSIPPAAAARFRDSHHALEAKRKQGMSMWQRVMAKGKHESKESVALLPVNAKEMGKQSCTAIPFTQQVTAAGCETVPVPNRLCFGQCSSLFVPTAMDDDHNDDSLSSRARQGGQQCSRCAPSKSHVVTVPLRCGGEVRQKRVMVVEECKCETAGAREETKAHGSAARAHL